MVYYTPTKMLYPFCIIKNMFQKKYVNKAMFPYFPTSFFFLLNFVLFFSHSLILYNSNWKRCKIFMIIYKTSNGLTNNLWIFLIKLLWPAAIPLQLTNWVYYLRNFSSFFFFYHPCVYNWEQARRFHIVFCHLSI